MLALCARIEGGWALISRPVFLEFFRYVDKIDRNLFNHSFGFASTSADPCYRLFLLDAGIIRPPPGNRQTLFTMQRLRYKDSIIAHIWGYSHKEHYP